MQKIISSFLLPIVLITASCSREATFVRKGNSAFDAGNYPEAILNYRKAVQKNPGDGDVYYRLGLAHIQQQEDRFALAALNKASALRPADNRIKAKLADVCFKLYTANPDKTQALYNKVVTIADGLLAQDRNSYDGLRLKGEILFANRRIPEGIELLKKADEIKPDQSELEVPLMQALQQNNQADEAEKLGLRLLSHDPRNAGVYNLIYLAYMRSNRTPEAEAILQRKVRARPQDGNAALELAGHYLRIGNRPRAQAELDRVIADTKDYPLGRLQVGEFQAGVGNFKEARALFEEGAKDSGNWSLYKERLAALLWKNGKRDDALQIANAVVAAKPDDIEATRLRGSFLIDMGNPKDMKTAIADYSAVASRDPDDAILHFQLGRAYHIKGERANARKHFEKAVQLNSGYLSARMAVAEMNAEDNNFSGALRQLEEISSVDPANVGVRVLHAVTLRNMNRIPDAESELLRLSREAPADPDVQLQLGLTRLLEKKFKEAEQSFARVYRPGLKDTRAASGLVEAYAGQKQYGRAVQLLRNELAQTQDPVGLQLVLSDMLARSGDLDGARDNLRKTLAADPHNAAALTRLGQVLLMQQRNGEAVEALSEAAKLNPKDFELQTNLGTALQQTGNAEQAKVAYRTVLASQPENPIAANNLAFLLAQQGRDLDEALRLAQGLTAKSPGNPNYADTLALVYLKKGSTDAAIHILTGLTTGSNCSAICRIHLGMAFSSKGDTSSARNQLELALHNQPTIEQQTLIHNLLANLDHSAQESRLRH